MDLDAINKIIDVNTIILIPIILQTYLSDILAKNNNSLHSSSFHKSCNKGKSTYYIWGFKRIISTLSPLDSFIINLPSNQRIYGGGGI